MGDVKLIVFGNPAIEMDSLAIKVGDALRKEGHEVLHVEDPLELLGLQLDEFTIIDVAEGISEPRLITSVDRLSLSRLTSLHDFDMAYFLKLMKATGRLERVRIVALPIGMPSGAALGAVRDLLHNL